MNNIFYYTYRLFSKIKSFIRSRYVISCLSADSDCPRILGDLYINAKNIKIGKNVTIYPGVYIWGNNIEIGDNVNIGVGTIIFSRKHVYIGNDTIIAGQCYIIDSNHSVDKSEIIWKQPLDISSNGIYIGNDVWIGAQCAIIKGAIINDGAVIGAQSLVNKEIPSYAIAYGTPVKVSSYRK